MPSPRKLVPIVLLAASFGAAHADPKPRPPTAEQSRLRDQLRDTDPDVVTKDLRPYAPLCDADGYPLVGNAAGSGKGAMGMQPSEYCTFVRAARSAPQAKQRSNPRPTTRPRSNTRSK